jgi:outer membrane protein W
MYAFIIPWEVGTYYYFTPTGIADPYVGLTLGGDYMEEHILIQEYDIYKTQWGFIMSPAVGVLIKFGRYSHLGANVSARYWFNTNSFSFTSNKTYDLMQGLNFNIGLCYLLR